MQQKFDEKIIPAGLLTSFRGGLIKHFKQLTGTTPWGAGVYARLAREPDGNHIVDIRFFGAIVAGKNAGQLRATRSGILLDEGQTARLLDFIEEANAM